MRRGWGPAWWGAFQDAARALGLPSLVVAEPEAFGGAARCPVCAALGWCAVSAVVWSSRPHGDVDVLAARSAAVAAAWWPAGGSAVVVVLAATVPAAVGHHPHVQRLIPGGVGESERQARAHRLSLRQWSSGWTVRTQTPCAAHIIVWLVRDGRAGAPPRPRTDTGGAQTHGEGHADLLIRIRPGVLHAGAVSVMLAVGRSWTENRGRLSPGPVAPKWTTAPETPEPWSGSGAVYGHARPAAPRLASPQSGKPCTTAPAPGAARLPRARHGV